MIYIKIFFIFGVKLGEMYFIRNVLWVLLFITGSVAYGQSDIFLTQQWLSRINMNPAATGNSNNVDVYLLRRMQWVGFDNAPTTNILNAHSYFNTIQSGLGFSLMHDKLGVSRQTVDACLSYAYHIDLTEKMLLSLGLSGGMYNNNWDPTRNILSEEDEKGTWPDKLSRTSADFNTGLEFNAFGITFGTSVTHLLNSGSQGSKIITDPITGIYEKNYIDAKPGREIYGYLRYRVAINNDLDLASGIMYRYVNYSNFIDINITAYYQKSYWLGVSFRPDNSFAAMCGVEYGMFRVGYAYDRSVGLASPLAGNTHEVMLSARFQKPQKGRKTTRFLD